MRGGSLKESMKGSLKRGWWLGWLKKDELLLDNIIDLVLVPRWLSLQLRFIGYRCLSILTYCGARAALSNLWAIGFSARLAPAKDRGNLGDDPQPKGELPFRGSNC